MADLRNEQIERLRDENLVVDLAKQGGSFIKRHYYFSSAWFIGLIVTMFATGFKVDPDTNREYRMALNEANDIHSAVVSTAYYKVNSAYERYYQSKV